MTPQERAYLDAVVHAFGCSLNEAVRILICQAYARLPDTPAIARHRAQAAVPTRALCALSGHTAPPLEDTNDGK